MKPVKIGIAYGSGPGEFISANDMFEFIDKVEGLGFDSIWYGDHIIDNYPVLDPLVLLACSAARTKKIKIGTSVLLLPLRHPAVVAKIVSTIDYLSKGRVLFGIGLGGRIAKEYEVVEVPLKERGRRTNEAIEIMVKLWTQEKASHSGRYFHFEEITMEPRPVQKPHPPLWIGGSSPAALRRAAKWGTGWFPSLTSPEGFVKLKEQLAAEAKAIGRKNDIELGVYLFTAIGHNREKITKEADAFLMGRYGLTVEKAGARVAVGSPEECLKRIEDFVALGVDKFIVRPMAPMPDLTRRLDYYAKELLSRFPQA